MRTVFLLSIFAWMTLPICDLAAQSSNGEDPVLFRVEDQPIHVSEFEYIYNKNNGEDADYSEESLREYLDLYIRFKLKVQAARDMQLDTISSLQRELEGYRNQLSNSYLVDKQVINKLTRELYERKQEDVELSHILIKLPRHAPPSDTAKAYEKAMQAWRALQDEGASFQKVAMKYSQERDVHKDKGYLGYVTAKFPDGYYTLENAAYETPVGGISRPVRSRSGYHVVKVHDRRSARGSLEAAHILIRSGNDTASAKEQIFEIYNMLERGGNFRELARLYSQDENSAEKGGYIGTFGINTYEQKFEDAAFSLMEDGAYSKPVKTRIGWHIIRRIDKKELPPYYKVKERLKAQISNDQRMEEAREQMIDRIQREGNFLEREKIVKATIDSLDQSVLTYRWQRPKVKEERVLFTLGDETEFTDRDFYHFLQKSARMRMQLGRRYSKQEALEVLYEKFVSQSCLDYEEKHLMEKYPEFRALMREYEEGILLFEATQRKVWNKASRDTAGLQAFYEKHKSDYMWNERVRVTVYEIDSQKTPFIEKCKRYIRKHPPGKVTSKFNKDTTVITYMQNEIEKGAKEAENVAWKEGEIELLSSPDSETYRLRKTEDLLPPQPKALNEARGYIIADYQDYLEKQWIESLRDRYEVAINEEVLKELIRK